MAEKEQLANLSTIMYLKLLVNDTISVADYSSYRFSVPSMVCVSFAVRFAARVTFVT